MTQQAVFNAVFHVSTMLAYREYSPGVVTSVLTVTLRGRLTRAALAEHRLSKRDLNACVLVAGIVHAAVVARQVLLRWRCKASMTRARALLALRVVSGGVFVVFGVGKFVNHGAELASFKSYGLPVPGVFVIAIGVIEIVGGALLISGRVLRPTTLVLAGDMIGAIVVSGVSNGEIISLTLAPALLVAMIVQLLAELRRPSVPGQRPHLR